MNSGHRVSFRNSRLLGDNFDDKSILVVFRHISARNEFAVLRDVEWTRHYRAARLFRAIFVEIRAGDIVMQSTIVTDVQVGCGYFGHEVVYVRHGIHAGVIVIALKDRRIIVFIQHSYRHVHVSMFRIMSQRSAGLRGINVKIRIVGRENRENVFVSRLAIKRFIRIDTAVGFVHVKGVSFVA